MLRYSLSGLVTKSCRCMSLFCLCPVGACRVLKISRRTYEPKACELLLFDALVAHAAAATAHWGYSEAC